MTIKRSKNRLGKYGISRYYVDDEGIRMVVSDYSMTYGCEYVGCDVTQVITPVRDRFTLLFVHTIQQFTG